MTMTLTRKQDARPESPESFDGFAQQIQHVIDVAGNLHACKVAGDFGPFEEACSTAKLVGTIGQEPVALFYWNRLDRHKSTKPLRDVKSNSELSHALGIQLSCQDACKNRLLYHLFEAQLPGLFHADIQDGLHVGGKKGQARVERGKRVYPEGVRRMQMFDRRPDKGGAWHIPLFSLFQGKHPSDFIESHVAQKAAPLCEVIGQEFGVELAALLFRLQMILPDAHAARLVGSVLKRGMAGEEIVVTGAFCPDYAYEQTGDPNLPYRYTFDGLGTGIGLVAQQFARVIPPLSRLLTGFGVKHRIVLGIGDFEADAESVLARVGCDYAEFVRRCSASLDAFREAVGPDLPLTLELCDADRCNGRLRPYAGDATRRMLAGDFGRMGEVYPDPEAVLKGIVEDNGTFYKRWHGPDTTDDDVRRIVLAQGGEYAALSRIYAEDFGEGNVLIISGDRPMMHAFDNVDVVIPTLCVKRAY